MHPWTQFNDPSVGRFGSRIERSLISLGEAAEAAEFYDVVMLINGDLTHTKNVIMPQVQSALRHHFNKYKHVQHMISIGNHERPDKTDLNTLEIFDEFDNVLVFSRPTDIALPIDEDQPDTPSNNIGIVILPWTAEPSAFIQDAAICANRMRHQGITRIVLMAHYPVQGADLGNGMVLNNAPSYHSFMPDYYDALLFNDIHKQQAVGDKGYHLGATHANSFSDSDYNCHWWLLGVDKDGLCIWPLKTSVKGFVTAQSENEARELELAGNFTRINIKASIEKQIQQTDGPRIATANSDIGKLIDGYLETVNGKLDLNSSEVQCVKERIIWAIARTNSR